MDQEFDKVMEKMPEIEVNTAADWEHAGVIERGIKFINQRCRSTWAIMPFKQLPESFVIHLFFLVMWINSFPATQGISEKLSPRKIIIKRSLIFY